MAGAENIALVQRWWHEVWSEGRLDLIPELTTDPFRRHSENGTTEVSHEQHAAKMQQYRRVLRGCKASFESQVAEGDRVFSRIVTTGMSETGAAVTVKWLQEHRIEDGRLAETWALYTLVDGWDAPPSSAGVDQPSAGIG